MHARARHSGLGLVAGAVLLIIVALGLVTPAGASALQPPARPDTTRPRPAPRDTTHRDSVNVTIPAQGQRADSGRGARIDSVKGIPDSLHTPKPKRDSIQAPLARAEVPPAIGVGPLYRWTRDSVYSTGAVNLTDLLERVPGVTVFRSGFLASAQTVSYLGDMSVVRVFRDGVELDVVDPRAHGVFDAGDVQLTNADLVTVERAAGELRVHIRTWAPRLTTPMTRVDAFTGDEDTNLYRFFYGRRFGSGFDAQVGVQQFTTGGRNRRTGGGGNALDAMARVGWARGAWSVDGSYARLDRQRDLTISFATRDSSMPRMELRRNEGSLRVGYGDPESNGLWVQGIAYSVRLALAGTYQRVPVDSLGRHASGSLVHDTLVTPDSATSRTQYVLAAGYTLGAVRLSATDRVRAFGGATYNTPAARATYDNRLLSLSAFVEQGRVGGYMVEPVERLDSVYSLGLFGGAKLQIDTASVRAGRAVAPPRSSRFDLNGRLAPLPWFAVLGAVSRESRTSGDSGAASFAVSTARLEAAVQLHRLWLSAGMIARGADTLVAPRVYECLNTQAVRCAAVTPRIGDPAVTGVVFGARGRVYKEVYVDATGTAWPSGGAYRPQYQLRGEAGVQTNWLTRFPTGNFGFKFAVIDEYRSRVLFPTLFESAEGAEPLFVPAANVLSTQLEIRILTGTLSYQLRNGLGRRYQLVPGLQMPGPVSYYGLRWTFFN